MEQIILDIPNGYEFFGINDDNKVVLTKKQPQYPKYYADCCEVLGLRLIGNINNFEYKFNLLANLQVLLICRDAYWKIAGEEMGLGKPWEPDWDNLSTTREFIKINKGYFIYSSRVLVFPTPKMRDAFYENFKDLIEKCKELL